MDPEQTAPTASSDLGLHCLSKRLQTFNQRQHIRLFCDIALRVNKG